MIKTDKAGLISHPRHSIVIPTFNRRDLLCSTLQSVLAAVGERADVEIIVADDGSTDGTSSFVEALPAEAGVVLVRQPDLGFRAAHVRNLGLRVARGDNVVLLDCGVYIQQNFFEVLDNRLRTNGDVVIFPVVGFSNDDAASTSLNDAVRNVRSTDTARVLADQGNFPDIREEVFDLCQDDLQSLPAPWAIAWTCCLMVPRTGPLATVWFDEAFVGWGGEDLDFALQLQARGAKFVLERQTGALHLPHEKSDSANQRSSSENKAYLDRKHGLPETKILRSVSAVDLNSRLLAKAYRA